MFNAGAGTPVFLKRIDADLPVGRHVGVEDARQKEAFGGHCGEVLAKDQLHAEHTIRKRRVFCTGTKFFFY